LTSENAGNLTFQVPLKDIDILSKFCETLEGGAEKVGIKDWGVSHTTLEDVFLKVAQEGQFVYSKM
jgi:hypothetical protein